MRLMLLAWAVIIITLKFLQNHLLKIENTRDDYILLIIFYEPIRESEAILENACQPQMS